MDEALEKWEYGFSHSVCGSLLSVEGLGDVKDPRVLIDNKKVLGGLIGPWSADLVG